MRAREPSIGLRLLIRDLGTLIDRKLGGVVLQQTSNVSQVLLQTLKTGHDIPEGIPRRMGLFKERKVAVNSVPRRTNLSHRSCHHRSDQGAKPTDFSHGVLQVLRHSEPHHVKVDSPYCRDFVVLQFFEKIECSFPEYREVFLKTGKLCGQCEGQCAVFFTPSSLTFPFFYSRPVKHSSEAYPCDSQGNEGCKKGLRFKKAIDRTRTSGLRIRNCCRGHKDCPGYKEPERKIQNTGQWFHPEKLALATSFRQVGLAG